ncbi:MAG: hypothetical protein OXG24_12470 [Gammaproteobacteria bacterium]|nr:hypothetical protein [Gammaproteobacteria bacterium]
MILNPGVWTVSGSWRATTDSALVHFSGECIVTDQQEDRYAIDIEAKTETSVRYEFGVWMARNETGLYDMTIMGPQIDLIGTAKLDSVPHLALLSDKEGLNQLATTLFTMPEVLGARGFLKHGVEMFTFEIAIKPKHIEVQGENIVPFRRRPQT